MHVTACERSRAPSSTASVDEGLPILAWCGCDRGPVVPAVIGHAFVSAVSVGMVKEFADRDAALDPLHMGLPGRPGWIATGAFVAVLAVPGRLRAPPDLAYTAPVAASSLQAPSSRQKACYQRQLPVARSSGRGVG
ncbi:hypothetical protein GCM10012287_38100 [Streptomyces daqingensis]|uniref:Uncharacterized protein n=1 Tax=Streptomyces daqingensis TaxID=1472640 RepID=A0ABQ2MJE2_9ACTN|nr:hypothetical protein GCM10012287_38100 [Streptomyces daqingensis]